MGNTQRLRYICAFGAILRANDIVCKVARARVDRFLHSRRFCFWGFVSIGGKGGLGCVAVGG